MSGVKKMALDFIPATKSKSRLKYKFTDEIKKLDSTRVAYRIEALRDFGDVKAGDKGGWIEKKLNLAQTGTCWVYDDATVWDEAKVTEKACVRGTAVVQNRCEVSGSAVVSGQARVRNEAVVTGSVSVGGSADIDGSTIEGNAVVSGTARVFHSQVSGDARVDGNTQVLNGARVCDMAVLTGNVIVNGSVTISGNAYLEDNAKVYDGERDADYCVIPWGKVLVSISDNVIICDNAFVQSSSVRGNVVLSQGMRVFNDSDCYETPLYGEASKFSLTATKNGSFTFQKAGCGDYIPSPVCLTQEEWLSEWEKIVAWDLDETKDFIKVFNDLSRELGLQTIDISDVELQALCNKARL